MMMPERVTDPVCGRRTVATTRWDGESIMAKLAGWKIPALHWSSRARRGGDDGRSPTLGELWQAVEAGAVNRLRPKFMTVAAIMLGLLPALWAAGTGAEVMQRIAAPMVGGMVSSTVLTLVGYPSCISSGGVGA